LPRPRLRTRYLALLCFPLISFFKYLLGLVMPQPPVDPHAPPPPPAQPPFLVAIQDSMWAYAERHQIYYLLSAFGVAFAIGLYYLFLQVHHVSHSSLT
jgi:hypothetical protein